MNIGAIIRQARIRAGYRTQDDLARTMGVSQNLISRWERADDVNTSTLRRLAEFMALPPLVFSADGEAHSAGEAAAHILAMVPEDMKAAVAAILADPDGREALNEWLRLFVQAPKEFRLALTDLIAAARQWPEATSD